MKTFEELFYEIEEKAARRDPFSGTVKALERGRHYIGKKIVEEAAEVMMAAEYESNKETAKEIAQLIYHLQVMMLSCGLTLDDIYENL